jgi:hypothetical protein
MSSIYGRNRFNSVQIVSRERAVLTIDTPMGPKEVAYGHEREHRPDPLGRVTPYGKGRDIFTLTYRGEEAWSESLDGIRKQVEKIEDEFQAKKRVEKVRKEAAKTPLPAVLAQTPGAARKFGRGSGFDGGLQDVHVRGIDQRSGKALITLADGTKDQVSPELLLRDIDDSDRADLMALYRAFIARQKERLQVESEEITSISKAVEGAEVDLSVRLDPETMERVAEYEGEELRARNDDGLLSQVYVRLVEGEWPYVEDKSRDRVVVPIRERLAQVLSAEGSHVANRLPTYSTLYKRPEGAARVKAAREAEEDAVEAILAAHKDLEFDLTQFVIPEPKDEPDEQPDEDRITITQHAPDYEPEF